VEHLRWERRPSLRKPVVIAAFEGWNDAGEASSIAVRYLCDRWNARPFARIEPEEFFDFTAVRPQVSLAEGEQQGITWPDTELLAAVVPDTDVDVIFVLGTEPQLRWHTYCAQIVDVTTGYDVRMVITLGALLAEVPHSRPVAMMGSASEPDLVHELDLQASCYEGPTGILAVLHDACMSAGLRAASLWAQVPSYVPAAPSPKAALALVEQTASLLGVGVVATDLEIRSASYERQVSELIEADEDTNRYVERLEERFDQEHGTSSRVDGDRLMKELERYLRDHPAD